jgi:rhodanese-related sulfurtransferase
MTVDGHRSRGIERGLAIGAVVLAGLAVVAGAPTRAPRGSVDVEHLAGIVEHEEDHVTAVELAMWIRDDLVGLRVIDIRPDSDFAEFHIPGAKRVSLADVARMPLDSTATYVLYSEGGTHAAQGWFLLRARGVTNAYFLRGGLYEWVEQVMSPRLPAGATQAERDSILALTRWFGGKPVLDAAASVLDSALAVPRSHAAAAGGSATRPPSATDTRAAVRKIRRRAC